MSDDLAALRAVAEAATPGPWRSATTGVRGGDHWYVIAGGESIAWIAANDGDNEEHREPDAAHMATFDPPTVLGLLDRLVAAEPAVERVRALADELAHPDVDLIVPFERATHRNIASQLRHALDGCPECDHALKGDA